MKILHLLNHCEFANGHVHVAVDLACGQVRHGDSVVVASSGGHYEALLDENGVEHRRLEQRKRDPASIARAAREVCRLAREFRPDLIHAHMMTGAVLGRVAATVTGSRLVTHVHNSFDRHSDWMRLGDRIISVSTAVGDQLKARGFPASKIRVVVNGPLESPRLSNMPAAESPDWPRPAIATLCGMHDRKGVRDLLAAFELLAADITGVHLYLLGDGPQRNQYEALAAAGRVASRIHFVGSVSDPRPMLGAIDVFVLASHADPCPLVIPEARAAGCAIIATRVDGIPEALDGGQAGILVPPSDPVRLAEALKSLLTDEARLTEAKRSALCNLDRFTTTALCARVDAVYKELAA
ncbi:MAG TPA: glycosyltransferase family 4 protein [Alphaproteobacteria bacterium]|nr:glycosyltransferase family 4 protein [Alphaproteobacteria bacterium]